MSAFKPAPEPKSKLGYYRLLSPSASVRVSPLCFGAMNIGDAWVDMMGVCNKETSFKMLDLFYDNGGNFIDTANNYQNEQSEKWIGEWMKKRNNRNEIVLATKFTTGYTNYKNENGINVNYCGNSRKSLKHSVDDSLIKLQTDFIDLLYVHWWDWTTSVEELMHSLHHLVQQGKVLYLGASDLPAWVVAKANQYARCNGLTPFVVYQGNWSILKRDLEREIIPMCKSEGMGIAPWGALGGGKLKLDEDFQKSKESGEKTRDLMFAGPVDEKSRNLSRIMDKIGKSKGTNITGVALKYVMQKVPYVFPIVGGRKPEQLQQNIDALTSSPLTSEEIKEMEDASPIDLGFPHDFMGQSPAASFGLTLSAKYQWVEEPKAITN